MDETVKQRLLEAQRNEITEHQVYKKLADLERDPHNKEVLGRIADDELRHYEFWKEHTGEDVAPKAFKRFFFVLTARLLGLTFAVKLMEKGEEGAQVNYGEIAAHIPGAESVAGDENDHEKALMAMIDEERLKYVGSVVLGLSDALVELTGALAGFTLALQKSRLIAVIGLITGIAASLSMAASEYLSTKTEDEDHKSPVKAALYTGVAYVFTVGALIIPFLLLSNPFCALALTVTNALVIIAFFTFYVSIAKDLPFAKRFFEMAGLSLGVALVSFGIGWAVRAVFGVDV